MSIYDFSIERKTRFIGCFIESSIEEYMEEACKLEHVKKTDFIRACIKEGVNQVFDKHMIKQRCRNG